MNYFLFLISNEEFKNGQNGWKHVRENEDRLVPFEPDTTDMDSFLTTLEKEVFHVVQDDAVYSIFKNYLDLTNNRRIYVMVNKERESDVYEEAIVEDEEGTTE